MSEYEIASGHEEDPGQNLRKLEGAGWERVEKNSQKILWRNPASGRLYPQEAAIKLMRENQIPEEPYEA